MTTKASGWTKYWNDVFKPDEPLDPDLVKALIATESSFELKPLAPNAGIAGYFEKETWQVVA